MDLALETARSGRETCRADSLYLHSRYDPEGEAAHYLDGALGDRSPDCIILAGACLDYLSPLIRARLPDCLLVSIQFSSFFRGRERERTTLRWYPDGGESLAEFFSHTLDEESCRGLLYLEWPPGARAFPFEAEAARKALKVNLDRLVSSAATLKTSGRRWILNACRSFLLAEELLQTDREEVPIVLAAAGPTLEEAIEDIRPYREGYRLVAVSSALAALRARGLEPDLVVGTDGGNWSRYHLYPLAADALPLAAPLTALPSAALSPPLLLLSQGFFPEEDLVVKLGGGIRIPSHGTVTGSALALAARLSSGPLLVCGLDLASRDIRSHASPQGFDRLIEGKIRRLSPLESLVWDREWGSHPEALELRPWRSSRSLAIYAAALEEDAQALRGRLFRLRPSPRPLQGFVPLEERELARLVGDRFLPPLHWRRLRPCPRREREQFLAASLSAWEKSAREAIRGFGTDRPLPGKIGELLSAADYPYWLALRRAFFSGRDPRPAAAKLEEAVRSFLAELKERLIP